MPVKGSGKAKSQKAAENVVYQGLGLRRVALTLEGMPPGIIFQGKGLMEEDSKGSGKSSKARPPEEEARLRAHWMGKGADKQLCIPWVMFYQSFCSAGAAYKFRGQKRMGGVMAATISCEQDRIPLNTSEFETYEEWVKIPPKTGAMVKIGRPRLQKWKVAFEMLVDDELYPVDKLKDIISDSGKLFGVGAWRPEKRGPYGKYRLMQFEVVE